MNARREIGWRHVERGREIDGGAAAETVTAAGKCLVVPMLMLRFGFPVMVRMLLRAGIVVSGVQMKRSMGVATDESDRQQ